MMTDEELKKAFEHCWTASDFDDDFDTCSKDCPFGAAAGQGCIALLNKAVYKRFSELMIEAREVKK